VQSHFREQGIELELYSPEYRFADLAFARTVPVREVELVLRDHPVQVLDTGYAIHLQSLGVNKGTALVALSREMGFAPSDFCAIGDSLNDVEMIKTAGLGIAVANAHPEAKKAARDSTEKEYGDGFVEAVNKYFSYFRAR
jgi:HAD superfamily hydrolase (TIGR01484 family)